MIECGDSLGVSGKGKGKAPDSELSPFRVWENGGTSDRNKGCGGEGNVGRKHQGRL